MNSLERTRLKPWSMMLDADAFVELASVASAMVAADERGRIVYVSRGAERLLGPNWTGAVGRDVSELLTALDEPLERGLESTHGTPDEPVVRILRWAGIPGPVEASIQAAIVRGKRFSVIVLRDATARVAQEDALRQSQAVLVSMQHSLPLGVFMTNGDGGCVHVNPCCGELLGLNPADCYGDGWVSSLHPDDRDRVLAEWEEATSRGATYTSEHRFLHKDGQSVWVRVQAAPIVCGGTRNGYVGVVDDITERRAMQLELLQYAGNLERSQVEQERQEQELRRAHEQLQVQHETLRTQAEELESARCRADEANQAKSTFLANMSHEIRTPMTSILGYADLLAESPAPPEQHEFVRTIQRNGEHLLDLINDILDLSKVEAGKLQIECLPTSPLAVVNDVASLLRIRAGEKSLPLYIECAPGVPESVLTDPQRMRQCLVNLVGNAVKFTEEGAVRVALSFEHEGPAGPSVRIDVTDSGIGLSPMAIGRLFQPFMQADASTTRNFGGTGLGLTISKHLARLLGGSLDVQSELGQGSTFSLRIPACANEVRPDEPTAKGAPASRSARSRDALNLRILLAEDGPDNQRLIAHVLRAAGAQVELVENGLQAVERLMGTRDGLSPETFDLVLMDMQMPVLDGYSATSQLRELGYHGPIVALTAHAMSEDRAKCLAAGCDGFATKPLRREALFATIRDCLKRPSGAPDSAAVEPAKGAVRE